MKSKIYELISYGIFGCITTLINLVLFYLFTEAGLYYLWSNTISYIIAVIINYVCNIFFVFPSSAKSGKGQWLQLAKFVSLRLFSLLIDNALFYIIVSVFGFPVYISRIMLSAAIILFTYVINKLFVFSKKKS